MCINVCRYVECTCTQFFGFFLQPEDAFLSYRCVQTAREREEWGQAEKEARKVAILLGVWSKRRKRQPVFVEQ